MLLLPTRRKPHVAPFSALAWLSLTPGIAGLVNRTIDDQGGDSLNGALPTYAPQIAWANQNCGGCAIHPDTAQTYKGTFTAATYNSRMPMLSITMQFTGVAIYVFFVLANNQGLGVTTFTTANFTVDGNMLSTFTHIPDESTKAFQYNQLVFSQQNLDNTQHTLLISTSGIDRDVYVDFDYAIYSQEDPVSNSPITTTSTTSTSSTNTQTSISSTSATSSSTTTNAHAPGGEITTTAVSTTRTVPANGTASATGSSSTTGTVSTSGTGIATTISTAHPNGTLNSNATSHSHVPVAAVAGGVVGGIAIMGFFISLFICYRRQWQLRALRPTIVGPTEDFAGEGAQVATTQILQGQFPQADSIPQLATPIPHPAPSSTRSKISDGDGGHVSDGIEPASMGPMPQNSSSETSDLPPRYSYV